MTAISEDKLDLLRRALFFKGTEEFLLKEIAGVMKPVHPKANELIIKIGDEGDGMYVINSGRVKVHFENLTVAELGPSEVFGEMAILETTPRTMSVTALEDSQLFFINRTAFRSIVGETIAKGIVNLLISRIKGDNQRMIEEFKIREKELTDLVNQRTIELQQKNEELIRTQKYKEQFLANMSHEIRTPMNAVVGVTNLLLSTDVDSKQLKYLETIKHASENLLVIINDILDFSKIEAGKLEIEEADFNLRKVIDGMKNTIHHRVEEKSLELLVEIDEEIPEYLVGDQVRLNQILLNLAGNAVKFTSKGKISVKCQLLERDGTNVRLKFSVTDTGIGIPKEKQGLLFQSFSQADSDTTRIYGGTGLGLAISRQLVELQGGTIAVESEPGKGSTFYFDLRYPVGKAELKKKSKAGGLDADLQNLKILLAEDDDFNQMVARDTLELLIKGVTVDIAANGKVALEKAGKDRYDLILMDVNMPVMDGYEATRQIRKLPPPACDVKIMAMTASVTQNESDKSINSGMNDFISKPFRPEDLFAKIAGLMMK